MGTVIDLEEYRFLRGIAKALEGVDLMAMPTVGFDEAMARFGLTAADLDDDGGDADAWIPDEGQQPGRPAAN